MHLPGQIGHVGGHFPPSPFEGCLEDRVGIGLRRGLLKVRQQLLDRGDCHARLPAGADQRHEPDVVGTVDTHGSGAIRDDQTLFLVEMQGAMRHAEEIRHFRNGDRIVR